MHPEYAYQLCGVDGAGKSSAWQARPLWRFLLVAFSATVLAACGGGSSGSSSDPDDDEVDDVVEEDEVATVMVSGNATKGPLANADVSVFVLDTGEDDLRGDEVASGSTNEQAAIEVDLADDTEGLLVVEVTANDDTTDLTTGQEPVLTRLSSVTEAADWLEGQAVYATPLSHMAVEITAANIGGEDVGRAQTRSALARAQSAVRSTVGFGLLEEPDGDPIDLFTTAPILTNDAADVNVRRRTLRYRKASEAVAAVLADLSGSTEAAGIEALFDDLVADLSTGRIDDEELAGDLEQAEPETLPIPNDPEERTVASTRDVVNAERERVGGDSEDLDDLTAEDDAPSEPAQRDSGLDSESLAGGVAEITLGLTPDDAGAVSTRDADPVGDSVFEAGLDDQITVVATAGEDFAFVRWSVNGMSVSGDAAYSFAVEDDRELVAEFSGGLELVADPADGGSPSGGGQFEPDESVSVQANPNDGFSFDAWVERHDGMYITPDVAAEVADAEKEIFTLDMPDEPLVLFALYDFTAASVGENGGGSIEYDGTFNDGEEVTLTAVPSAGFVFVAWEDGGGGVVSTDLDYTFEYSAGEEFTAVFAPEDEESGVAVWDDFDWSDGSVWAGD